MMNTRIDNSLKCHKLSEKACHLFILLNTFDLPQAHFAKIDVRIL
jgi:hypothetical protein